MKHLLATTTLAAALGVFGAVAAQAAIGDGIASAKLAGDRIAQVEDVQFFFGGRNFCWYDAGWQGPGWYWCGYAERRGYGWGGGAGFHGWTRPGHGPGIMNRGPMGGHKGPMSGPKGPMGGPKGPMGGHKGPPGGKRYP